MEPRIHYCTTSDGVSIAYSVTGNGTPFLQMPALPLGHLQMEWQIPMIRTWYERLGATRTLVRYDARGIGLSERSVSDFSVDSLIRDLDAVVDRLNLERFALFAAIHAGPVAIAYAARHPERVSHLVLWSTWARGSDWQQSPQVQATRALVEKDWTMYTETVVRAIGIGWEFVDSTSLPAFYRESVTPETFVAAHRSFDQFDVTGLLSQVTVPTLVVQGRQSTQLPIDVAKGLAARIPDARLAILERSGGVLPYVGDQEEGLRVIGEFLGGDAIGAAPAARPSDVRTVLFTDLVGHTEMMQRLGDDRGRDVLREHERITRKVLNANGGTELKTMGDGFMASFGSVTKAVECAIALQRAFASHEGEPLSVRVGLNAGEPIEEDGDLFGATVILASRIAAKADGGEILVADTVRGLCSGKGFLFADRGEFVAKGIEEPVRISEVSWRE